MIRRVRTRPLPPWMADLVKEFLRPPYFLQYLQQQPQSSGSPGDTGGNAANPGTPASSAAASQPASPAGADVPRVARRSAAGAGSAPANGASGEARGSNPKPRQDVVPAAHGTAQTTKAADGLPTGPVVERSGRWQHAFRSARIPPAVAKAYGWNVQSAEVGPGIVKVHTKRGVFALKRTDIPPERVRFIHELTQHLNADGFDAVPAFALTKAGDPFVQRGQAIYYATRWVAGNPVNFSSLPQVEAAATALARLHESSRGFEPDRESPAWAFDVAELTRRRAEDLRALLVRAEAARSQDGFDETLLRLAPQLRKDAERSLRILESSPCQAFLKEDAELPGVCHLDVIPSNLVFTPGKRVVLLDLDLATYAPRALDLGHLLRRVLQVQNWRHEAAYTCFSAYHQVRPLRAEEYLLIHGLLTFPYRAWRVAYTRYRLFRDPTQLDELRAFAEQEPRRQAFLEAYENQLQLRVP
ncbi:MAG: phosphotransferase [Alicyclobacillus macrosporangiidus]|uniref:phosphotransferase n=1 Tax=Alicyclobacillus macrosporangiidus TaxID=392015 RepID=UPI0026ECD434|nr:phosphotransferase [Alicyclobacillus macrosporangiidus]MCL6597270.1 phosphotransferase [Alicyclobacillus macrosporangiidus]